MSIDLNQKEEGDAVQIEVDISRLMVETDCSQLQPLTRLDIERPTALHYVSSQSRPWSLVSRQHDGGGAALSQGALDMARILCPKSSAESR